MFPAISFFIIGAPFQFLRQTVHDLVEVAVVDLRYFMRNAPDDALQKFVLRQTGRRAVQHEKARASRRILRRQRDQGHRQERQRTFFTLPHDEQVAAALPLKYGFGRSLDGIGRPEPDARRHGRF